MRMLVVEDDPDLRRQLSDALTHAGYAVDTSEDGEDGHFLGDTEPYDAVILDLGLPKMDGVTVLERWREDGKDFPVLILTARDRWSEKVAGFDAGADDYLTKPFYTEELLARVRALLRRASGPFITAMTSVARCVVLLPSAGWRRSSRRLAGSPILSERPCRPSAACWHS